MRSVDMRASLLHRPGREAAHQLAREEDVEHQDRRDRQRQRGEHAFQSTTYWPMNCCTPSVMVCVPLPGARISGNQRSFQIGTMVKTATVAMAGRTSGRITSRRCVSSDAVAARGVAQVARDLLHEFGQQDDGERQALRGIDQDQRRQRVDQTGLGTIDAGW